MYYKHIADIRYVGDCLTSPCRKVSFPFVKLIQTTGDIVVLFGGKTDQFHNDTYVAPKGKLKTINSGKAL